MTSYLSDSIKQDQQTNGSQSTEIWLAHTLIRVWKFCYNLEPLRKIIWTIGALYLLKHMTLCICSQLFPKESGEVESNIQERSSKWNISRSEIVHMTSIGDAQKAAAGKREPTMFCCFADRQAIRPSPSVSDASRNQQGSKVSSRSFAEASSKFSPPSVSSSASTASRASSSTLKNHDHGKPAAPKNSHHEFGWWWSLAPNTQINRQYTKNDILRMLREDMSGLNMRQKQLLNTVQMYWFNKAESIEPIVNRWLIDCKWLLEQLQAHLRDDFANALQSSVIDQVSYEHARVYLRGPGNFHLYNHEGGYKMFVEEVEEAMSSALGRSWSILQR